MTWFHGLQLVCWGAAVWWSGRQARVLLFSARLDSRPVLEELETLLPTDRVAAMKLLGGAGDAWIGLVGLAYLRPSTGSPADGALEAHRLLEQLQSERLRGLEPLVTLGRIAFPLAILGVIFELTDAFVGDQGLEALQRGLPEQLALGRAATGLTIGVMTTLFCLVLTRVLSGHLRRLVADAVRTQEVIERALPAERDQ